MKVYGDTLSLFKCTPPSLLPLFLFMPLSAPLVSPCLSDINTVNCTISHKKKNHEQSGVYYIVNTSGYQTTLQKTKYLVVSPVKPGTRNIESLLRTDRPVTSKIPAVHKHDTFAPALWTRVTVHYDATMRFSTLNTED